MERFAERDPDLRLRGIVEDDGVAEPRMFRVLDLGCAAGRNTVYLAERGVDVLALDASAAMVSRTRRRLAPFLGEHEAARRVRLGRMTDFGSFADTSFDLVIALGVIQTARSLGQWNAAVAEIDRVLAPDGRMLVSNFSSESRPKGEPLEAVGGEEHVYRWRDDRPMVLMDADAHDASFAEHGFVPDEPTESVRVPLEGGFRVTVNALYRRAADSEPT